IRRSIENRIRNVLTELRHSFEIWMLTISRLCFFLQKGNTFQNLVPDVNINIIMSLNVKE
ncbi:hypothetical protein DD862_11830, partial [Staphylococcus pseudintermedius]